MKKRKLWLSATALLLVAVLAFGQGLAPARAQSAEADELEEQLEKLAEERAELDSQIEQLRSQLSDQLDHTEDLMAQKDLIDQEIFLLYQQVDTINEQIRTYSDRVVQAQEAVEAAQAEFEAVRERNKSRIRVMEKNGTVSYWSVVFQAVDLLDLLDRLKSIDRIARADRACLEEVRQAAQAVEAAKTERENELAAMELTRQELLQTQALMEQRSLEAQDLLRQAIASGEEFAYLLEKSEEQQDALAEEIAKTQLAYEEATRPTEPPTTEPPPTQAPTEPEYTEPTYTEPAQTEPTYTEPVATEPETTEPEVTEPETTEPETTEPEPTEPEPTEPTPPVYQEPERADGGAYWMVPCEYVYMSSPFGYRYHPITDIWKMHNGIDLAAYQGNPIYATRSGYVTRARYEAGGAGYYVSLDHGDGYSSIYMHMTHYIVGEGEYVEQGQIIGYVGSTGGSTGPHLHFGISLWGTYVNPADYIAV